MDNRKWWEDFLEMETDTEHEVLSGTYQIELNLLPVVPMLPPPEEPKTVFNSSVNDVELNEGEAEIFYRMNDLFLPELIRLFGLGIYYDTMKQLARARHLLFDATLKLEAYKNGHCGDQFHLEQLEHRKVQFEREIEFLQDEVEDIECMLLDAGILDD